MGTNYYVYKDIDGVDACETIHIGKSSMGWVFSLRVYPEQGIHNLYDWLPILVNDDNLIMDEYQRVIKPSDLLMTITGRRRLTPPQMDQAQLELNHAEPGPNNLLRHRAGTGCTHGEGTWDYCNYEFC